MNKNITSNSDFQNYLFDFINLQQTNFNHVIILFAIAVVAIFVSIVIHFSEFKYNTTSSFTLTTLSNTTSNTVTLSNDKQLLFINHVDKLVKNTKYCSIKDYSDDNELYIVCDNYKIIFNQKEKQVDKIEIAVTVIENNSIVLESAGDPIYVREDKLLSEENIKKLDDIVANSIDDILNKDKQKEISEKEEHILNFIKKQELIENTTDL